MSAIKLHSDTSRAQALRAYWFYGDLAIVHLSGEDTDGRFARCSSSCSRPAR